MRLCDQTSEIGCFSRLHRFDKVSGVVCTDLSAIDLLNGTFGQRVIRKIFDGLANDLATVDEEATFRVPSNRMPLSPSLVIINSTSSGMSARILNSSRCCTDRSTTGYAILVLDRQACTGPVRLYWGRCRWHRCAQQAISTWWAPQSVSFPPEYSCQFRNE